MKAISNRSSSLLSAFVLVLVFLTLGTAHVTLSGQSIQRTPRTLEMPRIVGGGNDAVAMAPAGTLIGDVTGGIGGYLTSESDSLYGGDSYSVQINSNRFACNTQYTDGRVSTCWQQFVFEFCNDLFGCGGSFGTFVKIEYWAVNYYSTFSACPKTGPPGGSWSVDGNDCVADSPITYLGLNTFGPDSLGNMVFHATADGTNDQVRLVLGTSSWQKTMPDGVFDLANSWTGAEFNIFGYANLSQANFASGTDIVVGVTLRTGQQGLIIPTCQVFPFSRFDGWTGETNDLYLQGCSVTCTDDSCIAQGFSSMAFSEYSSPPSVTINTIVFDESTNAAWSGTETAPGSAFDLAIVIGNMGLPLDGTVQYNFYHNGTCSGGSWFSMSEDVGSKSFVEGLLSPGQYSFQATYAGDTHYSDPAAVCEPFAVKKAVSAIRSVIYDVSTNSPWSSAETAGAIAYDTVTLTGFSGLTPTGMVTYYLFSDSDCAGAGVSQTVRLTSAGDIPDSQPTLPLTGGFHSYLAIYSGDENILSSTSNCESFFVNRTTVTITSSAFDASTKSPWSGTEIPGSSAYDNVTINGVNGVGVGSIVTSTLYDTGDCSGSGITDAVYPTSVLGAPPTAYEIIIFPPTSVLSAGPHSFNATYDGNSNYLSTKICETFTVGKASPTITAELTPSSISTEGSATDLATLTGGYSPTGSVTYTAYDDTSCTSPVFSENEPIGTPSQFTPKSKGTFFFIARYSGDHNNNPAATICGAPSQTLAVNKAIQNVSSAPASTILGLDPTTFYEIIGVIIAIVAIASGLTLRLRKKHLAPR